MKTFMEYPAVAKSLSKDDFAIVIHLKAPSTASRMFESTRAPVDLVTVLDVSGSMQGAKLSLLKQAMKFVIQNLGPADRLSIVSFSSTARRLIRLTRMSNEGVHQALNAVNSLTAGGGTNIAEGLRKGAKVLYLSYLLILFSIDQKEYNGLDQLLLKRSLKHKRFSILHYTSVYRQVLEFLLTVTSMGVYQTSLM